MAASAGDNVSALKSEIAMEKAIVSENCLYRIPVVPGKNDTGTNTEISTSDVATTALATSAMATDVAVCGSVPSSLMWRCAFSMTTMASSTTSPVASVIPKSVSELMEKSKILMNANVPISETGMVTAGMMVARQSSRKKKDHNNDDDDRFLSVVTTSFTESPTTVVVSNAMTYLMPGGNDFASSISCGLCRFVHFQRIGIRELLHADADGLMSAVHEIGVVALGADFGASHILQLDNSVRRVFENDVFEFASDRTGGRLRASVIWKFCFGSAGGRPNWPAGISTFCSCSAEITSAAVSCRARQLRRIKPDAHGVLALAEDDHIADARNALQRVLDVNIEIVRDVLVRKTVIGRDRNRGENEVRIRLGDGDAGVLDFLRQAALAVATRFCTSTAAMFRS